ncbi:hypothetical protein Lser_V15G10636 [Lactuca serriola]
MKMAKFPPHLVILVSVFLLLLHATSVTMVTHPLKDRGN